MTSLFDHPAAETRAESIGGPDVAAGALSVAHVDNDFLTGVYEKLASTYDLFFGPWLHPGRVRAVERMAPTPGERILEVGTGTGINLDLYPSHCHVTGVDLSASMLEKAHERVAKKGMMNVRLYEMDATHLQFADDSFDIVYAPYLINVVPDPIAVAREMRRVCRPGGRIMFLNHFHSAGPFLSRFEKLLSHATIYIGFKTDLALDQLLSHTGLTARAVEGVNRPKTLWSLVTCIKTTDDGQ